MNLAFLSWNIKPFEKNNFLKFINDEKSYLLNSQLEKYSLLEKYIFDIAMFHFQRLQLHFDPSIYFIEFSFKKNNNNSVDIICDEVEKNNNNKFIYPFCSTITYLNDCMYPTFISNIDLEQYKYKQFSIENTIAFSFPKKLKHICFDGSKYHGISNIYDSYDNEDYMILSINLWEKKPTNVVFFDNTLLKEIPTIFYNKEEILFEFEESKNSQSLILDTKIVNLNFFENIFYKKTNNVFFPFNGILSNIENYKPIETDIVKNSNNYIISSFILPIKQNKTYKSLLNKYGEIIEDVSYIHINSNLLNSNRFYKNYIVKNILNEDICKWIISESEKFALNNGGWIKKYYNSYPKTELQVNKLENINSFIKILLQNNIFKKIRNVFHISEEIKFNLIDLFIVKYSEDEQTDLDLYKEGSFISFIVMLNERNEYEGGGFFFEDDEKTEYLDRGDIIIYSSKLRHSGEEIIKGKRYIMVGFIDLHFEL